jgi:hypothetical protein
LTKAIAGAFERGDARKQIGLGVALPRHAGLTSKVRVCAFENW